MEMNDDKWFMFWLIFIQTCVLVIVIYVLLQYGFNIRIYHIAINETKGLPGILAGQWN